MSPGFDGSPLKVWIVQNGEEIPSDPGHQGYCATAFLAEHLDARGHQVTYWAPSFNHQRRRQRTPSDLDGRESTFAIRLLPARSFSKNI